MGLSDTSAARVRYCFDDATMWLYGFPLPALKRGRVILEDRNLQEPVQSR